ncbi:MAG: hypothetical protein U0Y68_10120 [Blastocatellia bacterium]
MLAATTPSKDYRRKPVACRYCRTARTNGAAAVRIGQALQYTNAGTVEFILAPTGEFISSKSTRACRSSIP